MHDINPLSANPTKWSDKLKQFVVPMDHLLEVILIIITAQKMKFPIKDFFSKCDQIRSFLNIQHTIIIILSYFHVSIQNLLKAVYGF